MEFFCYHRDRPGSTPLRNRMVEERSPDRYVGIEVHRWQFGGRPG